MRELQAIRGPACFEINAKRRRTHGRMSFSYDGEEALVLLFG